MNPDSEQPAAGLATLARALDRSEQAKAKVEEHATDLSSVNTVLKQELAHGVSLKTIEEALEKSDAALTERRVQERRARHRSLHDAVTGLPSMTLFNDRLESALIQAARHAWRLAVMFMNLDEFKSVNDIHGREVGDRVLQMVARRLERFIRGGDTVSRRGGDEFLLLMLEAKDEDTVAGFAQKIVENISAPCDVKGIQLTVKPSIGIAIFPEDGQTAEELLRHADTAMYVAKRLKQGAMLYGQMGRGTLLG